MLQLYSLIAGIGTSFWPTLLPMAVRAGSALRFPAIAAFFSGLFSGVITWFLQFFGKKAAIQYGIITVIVGITVTLFTAIKLSIAGLSLIVPDFIQSGFNMVIPNNFVTCISLVFGAKITRWGWAWSVHFIEISAGNNA